MYIVQYNFPIQAIHIHWARFSKLLPAHKYNNVTSFIFLALLTLLQVCLVLCCESHCNLDC